MPRKARIDAPGALHHIIIRGIERKAIYKDIADRHNFLRRLGNILSETATPCFAWALIPNHAHLLLRTGMTPIATIMRRLLTGYAQQFNRRHHRHGQLFQNRYKSILCEEDPYLLELVRYIHLNPIRAQLVKDMKTLKRYPFTGHSVINGTIDYSWQDKDYVLKRFGGAEIQARRTYNAFVAKGIDQGRRLDLIGGGLVRSSGGWSALKALRKHNLRVKGDERILGGNDFVERVLKAANETLESKTEYEAKGLNVNILFKRTVTYYQIEPEDLMSKSKISSVSIARAVFCYLSVRRLNASCIDIATMLNITPSAVSKAVKRGQSIVAESNIDEDLMKC